MKKIIKNRVFQICFVVILVVLLIMLCFINRYDEDVVTRARKILGYKYYNMECINDACDYVVSYSGSKKGNTKIKIINSKGKTVVKYSEDYSKNDYKRIPVAATNKYAILAKKDAKNYTTGYVVINFKGKEILNEDENSLFTITNELFYSKKNDLFTVYDYTGKIIYDKVSDLKFYNNNKIITFVNNEFNIMNEKSEKILDGYKILEEVKKEDKTIYLILEDQNSNYYYFDTKKNKIIGDSFNNYIIMSNNKIMATKKINNKVEKFILDTDGSVESKLLSNNEIYDKITKNIDKETYQIVDDTIFSERQKGILVKNVKENSLGTLDIKTGDYNKLFNFKSELPYASEESMLNIYNLYESFDDVYLQVGCSSFYCDEENILVYNPMSNKVSFRVNGLSKEIKKYREYTNNYKVVNYVDKTYGLFDEENKEILTSNNNIVVVDQDILIDDDSSKSNVLLYSSKEKKLINSEKNLAILDTTSDYNFYKYSTNKYLYLYNIKGKNIIKINIKNSNLIVSDKYALYFENNKANIISLKTDKINSYNLTTKQFVIKSDSSIIPPYKGALIITDTNDNTVKIVNYNKKMIKKLKNVKVETVSFNKENNSIFMITKQDKNYGLYIIK